LPQRDHVLVQCVPALSDIVTLFMVEIAEGSEKLPVFAWMIIY
jgi:hypothetical protein